MASGRSAISNGAESEANMRAVGPYLLQRTLGKGQTGELEWRAVRGKIDLVFVFVVQASCDWGSTVSLERLSQSK